MANLDHITNQMIYKSHVSSGLSMVGGIFWRPTANTTSVNAITTRYACFILSTWKGFNLLIGYTSHYRVIWLKQPGIPSIRLRLFNPRSGSRSNVTTQPITWFLILLMAKAALLCRHLDCLHTIAESTSKNWAFSPAWQEWWYGQTGEFGEPVNVIVFVWLHVRPRTLVASTTNASKWEGSNGITTEGASPDRDNNGVGFNCSVFRTVSDE